MASHRVNKEPAHHDSTLALEIKPLAVKDLLHEFEMQPIQILS